MDERERRKRKYRRLRTRLKEIQREFTDLELEYNSMNAFLKESLLIDNKLASEELFSKTKNTMDEVQNELANTVLPMVSSKC